MNKYFKEANTLEELRKQYKQLLKMHHPDNGGNVADMQEINAEYDRLFKLLKDRHESKSADGSEKSTNQYREEFKDIGFKFARHKKSWYWHSEAFRKRSHKKLSMDDIRSYYGSTEVETEGTKRLQQA